jgi:hypothetical protein
MKKLAAILLAALVLLSAPAAFSIQFPRQVDPSTAPQDPAYGQGLYLFYASIVAAVSGGNFSGARALLAQTPFIHVPPEILDAVDSFDGLVNSTAALFRTVGLQLANASAYLATGRVSLARDNLTSAVTSLRAANQTLDQLFGAEPQLAALTGIPSSLFLQKLHPLESLYVSDSAEASRLLAVLTGLTKLEPTTVTLQVRQGSIKVGSDVSVSGTLVGPGGSPLASRTVTVYFENQPIGNASTDGSGAYSADLPTPYFYQRDATLFASFLPAGNDSLVYAPSTSPPANVTVDFATPDASLASPRPVYAGQPMTVSGTLTLGGAPLAGYAVSLSGFAPSPLAPPVEASARTAADGSFAVELTPPSALAGGAYPLTLRTSSNGTVGPLSVPLSVTVIKEDPAVSSSAPLVALAGVPFTVSGAATANGTGVGGAQVLVTPPGPSVEGTTSPSGAFSLRVAPPLTTPTGGWSFTVEVYPAQSWISPAPATVSVFVVNPLVLVFPASSLALLGLVVRRRRQALAPAPLPPPARAAGPPVPAAPPRPPAGLPGVAGVYYAAVALAERSTGVRLLPQMTVREYARGVEGALRGSAHFWAISLIFEAHLYGAGGGEGDESTGASELEALRREVEG